MAKLSIEIDETRILVRVGEENVVSMIKSLQLSIGSLYTPVVDIELVPAREDMNVGLLDSLRKYRELLEQCPFVSVR